MLPSHNLAWEPRSEVLDFQFGPITLGRASFKALVLQSNPFAIGGDIKIPLEDAIAKGCSAVVIHTVPVDKDPFAIRIENGALRYTSRYYARYVVDLTGSFAEYLKQFSKKSRYNLRRAVRKFKEAGHGIWDLREYTTPAEIIAFRDIAIAISYQSYKNEIGWGFAEGSSFARQLELDARAGKVRGYVLTSGGEPAAYGLCRSDHDVIVYKHIGYATKFARLSPGNVLLYMMLEQLFAEGKFRLFDFDGTDYFAYKAFFATRAIPCGRVVWFQPTTRNIALGTAHWVVTAAWRLAAKLRVSGRRKRNGWMSALRAIRLPGEGLHAS
jgi:hypothetical protein